MTAGRSALALAAAVGTGVTCAALGAVPAHGSVVAYGSVIVSAAARDPEVVQAPAYGSVIVSAAATGEAESSGGAAVRGDAESSGGAAVVRLVVDVPGRGADPGSDPNPDPTSSRGADLHTNPDRAASRSRASRDEGVTGELAATGASPWIAGAVAALALTLPAAAVHAYRRSTGSSPISPGRRPRRRR